jgi:hypothetical protein
MLLHIGDTFCTTAKYLLTLLLWLRGHRPSMRVRNCYVFVLLGRDLTARHYLVLVHSGGIVTGNPVRESHLVSVHLTPIVHSWPILTSVICYFIVC